ncbi:MAG: pantetheine-phosphate adenylyltransferase [Thermofilum sp.]
MKDCRKGAVGGTFSLLHRGHRLLLSYAALNSERLLIGVTSDEYAQSRKTHPVEPFELRALSVLLYVLTVNPEVVVEVVPIDDAYGPAVVDPELDCIFVSEETLAGALAVNLVRRLRGLKPLKIHSVEVILHEGGVKLSSTLLWKKIPAADTGSYHLNAKRHEDEPGEK